MLKEEFKERLKSAIYYPHKDTNKEGELIITENRERTEYELVIGGAAILDLTGNIFIGSKSYIASGAKIWTHYHDIKSTEILLDRQKRMGREFTIALDKIILEDVWIHESTVLAQCRIIAKGVLIGAGSVATKNITEPWSIWAGNPAKRIGTRLDGKIEEEEVEKELFRGINIENELNNNVEFEKLTLIREMERG